MKKPHIDDTHIWYNEGVHQELCSLAKKYDNAIPVFGGALGAYECIHCDNPNFNEFILIYLSEVIKSARFHKWHEGDVGALRRFCHICFVDPMLVEAYIGTTFEELCKH